MEAIRFVSSGSLQQVQEPTAALWPGFYRLRIENDQRTWNPVTLQEWREITPEGRLEIFLQQMRQIVDAKDAAGIREIDVGEEAAVVGLSAADFRQGLHRAICQIYQQVKKRRTLVTALGNLANATLLAIFGVEAPLANYSDEATLSVIVVYGERYCGKVEEGEQRDSSSEEKSE